jgi:site-specific DNA-cytosine methylase
VLAFVRGCTFNGKLHACERMSTYQKKIRVTYSMSEVLLVDLFCGLGGFSEGARRAGARVVLAVDSWQDALSSHKLNHPDCEHLLLELGESTTDILLQKLVGMRLLYPNAHIHLHGSPPCQGFSMANRIVTQTTTERRQRGEDLLLWYTKIASNAYSQGVISSWSLEQVKPAKRWYESSEGTAPLGVSTLIRASDHGAPTMRERWFAGNGWEINERTLNPSKRSVAEVLGLHPEWKYCSSAGNFRFRDQTKTQFQHLRKCSDTFTYTIVGAGLYFLGANGRLGHRRTATPKELLLIQGFSEEYKLNGSVVSQRKQVVNSVCPPVARDIISGITKTSQS